MRWVALFALVPSLTGACSHDRPGPFDAGPTPDGAARDGASVHSAAECATFAERACAGACVCEPTCRFYYPSASSQSFSTMENCVGALMRYCADATFDMAACDIDLPLAMCAPESHGSGLELPSSCFTLE